MPRLRIKGHANYDGIVGKSFDVVVEVSDTVGSSKKLKLFVPCILIGLLSAVIVGQKYNLHVGH